MIFENLEVAFFQFLKPFEMNAFSTEALASLDSLKALIHAKQNALSSISS